MVTAVLVSEGVSLVWLWPADAGLTSALLPAFLLLVAGAAGLASSLTAALFFVVIFSGMVSFFFVVAAGLIDMAVLAAEGLTCGAGVCGGAVAETSAFMLAVLTCLFWLSGEVGAAGVCVDGVAVWLCSTLSRAGFFSDWVVCRRAILPS